MAAGVHGHYRWLAADLGLAEFVALCPEAVEGRWIAVTASDSSAMRLTAEAAEAGWSSSLGIAYSPRIDSVSDLLHHTSHACDHGFEEWFVFHERRELGALVERNLFRQPLAEGEVCAFVNWFLDLRKPVGFEDLFWEQMDRLQPAGYLADGVGGLTFACSDPGLFAAVESKLL